MNATEKRLSWGILGTGNIAHSLPRTATSRTENFGAVGSETWLPPKNSRVNFPFTLTAAMKRCWPILPVEAVYITRPLLARGMVHQGRPAPKKPSFAKSRSHSIQAEALMV